MTKFPKENSETSNCGGITGSWGISGSFWISIRPVH
jgi:hypothetical protein